MPVIADYLAATGQSFAEVAARYDPISQLVAKSIVVISIPFFVPFVWAANPSKRFYLIDHSVFAIHIYAAILAWPILLSGLGWIMYFLGVAQEYLAQTMSAALALIFLYIILAQKRAYGGGYFVSLTKSLLLFVGIGVSHFIYRYIQFWLVWWQVT